MAVPAKDLRQLRGCTDRGMRGIIREAMETMPYRMTKGGVILYGDDGESMVSIHFTASDHRAKQNVLSHLRKLGFTPTKKGK